ncbi:MAG: Rrf2 family transcriptional regulator [Candidatus Avilachnospira sp.]|jgi:Rrf2 family protein
MMVSTKGRYALRVMIDIAQHKDEGYVSLKDVADRQEISMKYLELIAAILNRAGYLKSKRGKAGGYMLSKEPEKFNIGEILKLTEGSLAPVTCMENSGCVGCKRAAMCYALPMWIKLDNMIDSYLEGISLQDLIDGKV